MPQSVEMVGLTTVVLVLATAALTFFIQRRGMGDTTDSVVVLYRKLSGTHTKRKPRAVPKSHEWPEDAPRPVPARQMAAKGRRRFGRKKTAEEEEEAPEVSPAEPATEAPQAEVLEPPAGEDKDHVPLSDEAEQPPSPDETELTFRQRFRRGLRRTRERMGEDMREAFARGPSAEAFDQLEETLVAADVGVATATALVDGLRERLDLTEKSITGVLREAMVAQLQDADRRLRLVRGRLSVWVVCGVNGTGKTTTIAKLASRAKGLGLGVSLAAADTFRAAATEQLSEWAKRIGVDVVKQSQGADPGAVVFDAIDHAVSRGHELLIVDTAGRLHTRKPLMDELEKVVRVIQRDERAVISECLLVIDATTGQNGIPQAQAFREAVEVTGIALAKLDGTAKGGITFAVEREMGVPVKAVGIGEGANDLIPFDPQAFVEALVGETEATERSG